MSTSNARREKHRLISQWLCDAYGKAEDIPPFFWRDADDLIKFMKANGWCVRQCTLSSKAAPSNKATTSSLANLQEIRQEARQKLNLQ